MKQILCLLTSGLLLARACMAQAEPANAPVDWNRVQVSFSTDREPVDYHVNQEMTFTIAVDLDGQTLEGDYFIDWKSSSDDGVTNHGRVRLSEQPVVVKASLKRPGFVRLQAELVNADGVALEQDDFKKPERKVKIGYEGGAGADVDQIRQAVPAPDDFASFWERQKVRLSAVPPKFVMNPVESKSPGFDTFAVSVDCAGPRPVTGYLTIPTGAKDKSLPVRVLFYGYGVEKHLPHSGTEGEITFGVNAHGFDLDQDKDYYSKYRDTIRSNGQAYGFDPKQNRDPEKSYFNGMALRVMRALEFVKLQPQWDGKSLTVKGGSQGGLQSVWAAALDHDVSKCEVSIIWCTNMAGASKDGRLPGWHPEWVDELGYYDTVNHAGKIQCPVEIDRAGLGDYTSPPSGIAAFYNNLNVAKKISWVQGSTHGYISPQAETFKRSGPAKPENQ